MVKDKPESDKGIKYLCQGEPQLTCLSVSRLVSILCLCKVKLELGVVWEMFKYSITGNIFNGR